MFETAKWITAGKEFRESLPSFQKHFAAKGQIIQATAYITAYGVYDFFIDGCKVGKRIMAPGWTYYPKWIQYQTYDITQLIGKEATTAQVCIPGLPERTLTGGSNVFYSQEV